MCKMLQPFFYRLATGKGELQELVYVMAMLIDLSCLRDNVTNRVGAARSVVIQRKRFIGGC